MQRFFRETRRAICLGIWHTVMGLRSRWGASRSARLSGARLSGALLVIWLLAACDLGGNPTPTPPPGNGATPLPAEAPNSEPSPTSSESRQLVLWLPEFFDPNPDTNAGAILEGAFFQFEQNYPGLSLDVQIKSEFGQTGLLNYLRAAQRVAPTIMPDLVLIHSSRLWQIADLGILLPLEDGERTADARFFPFAQDSVTYREEVYGVPYTADILLGVMNAGPAMAEPVSTGTAAAEGVEGGAEEGAEEEDEGVDAPAEDSPQPATADLPVTWDDMLASQLLYVFPAGASEGSRLDSAVMHYLAAGGTLGEEGVATADTAALETFFEFVVLGRSNNVMPAWLIDYADYETLWATFAEGTGDLALASAQILLSDPDSERYTFLTIPAAGGEPHSIGNVWAFAVIAQDPERRALALALIEALLAPEIQGEWALAALRVPSQPQAMGRWGDQNPYYAFLRTQLDAAEAVPAGRPFADFARRLHTAQGSLIRGELTVEEAILEVRAAE